MLFLTFNPEEASSMFLGDVCFHQEDWSLS